MQSNFDGRVDPFEINSEAIESGDLELPEAFRKHGQYWLAGDELGAGRAMARRDERARIDLLTQIEELYSAAGTRGDVENIELQTLDTTYVTPFLSTGLQVHMPYTAYAHWFLLHRILTGAGVEKIQLNTDIDSMTRAAFLTAYADEVKRGDAHTFFVKYTKWQTIDERKRILDASKRKLGEYRLAAPGRVNWSKQKLARIDNMFQKTRRLINALERPIGTSSTHNKVWHGYAPYNPTMLTKYLTVFRAVNNFVFVGNDGRTPAMRLGFAKQPLEFEDIVWPGQKVPRPKQARRRGKKMVASRSPRASTG